MKRRSFFGISLGTASVAATSVRPVAAAEASSMGFDVFLNGHMLREGPNADYWRHADAGKLEFNFPLRPDDDIQVRLKAVTPESALLQVACQRVVSEN